MTNIRDRERGESRYTKPQAIYRNIKPTLGKWTNVWYFTFVDYYFVECEEWGHKIIILFKLVCNVDGFWSAVVYSQ